MIHIAIIENDQIWTGCGLTKEMLDWMQVSVGKRVHDMTALTWGNQPRWFMRTSRSKSDMILDHSDSGPYWLHFYFPDPKDAMLFKLVWCGHV